MPSDPYRVPPDAPPQRCARCSGELPARGSSYEGSEGAPICQTCFRGQYDLLAIFGIGALIAGVITGSGALLLSAFFIPGIAAYAIYRGNL